ncbi:hypothetical protein CTA1_11326 [Colletotrichum tanaceti]|uniref:Uncharacterized protein n=1 Tax=Colletotrichum tanaceti TaxID=1306861 RepID=A0A4U6X2H5_9PEZI|nr:hypothetical protein CTA1_11326 [Colletotrichum tanaceti]
MDPWCHCRRLPMGHHHRSAAGRHRQQRHPQPPGHRLVPHPHRHPVRLVHHPLRRHARPARDAPVPHQERPRRPRDQGAGEAPPPARERPVRRRGDRRDQVQPRLGDQHRHRQLPRLLPAPGSQAPVHRHGPAGAAAAHRNQLHLLLRHAVLPELGLLQRLRHRHDHVLHQRRVDPPGHVRRRPLGPPPDAPLGRRRHVRLAVPRRHAGDPDHRPGRRRQHHRLQPARPEGRHRLCVHLHLLLRVHLGSPRLGRQRRDLWSQDPCQVPLPVDRHQLAPQLGHRVRHPVPGQLRRRVRQPAVQDLLRLVRVLLPLHRLRPLLHLRDQGPDPRGGRGALRRGQRRQPVGRLEARHDLSRSPDRRGRQGRAAPQRRRHRPPRIDRRCSDVLLRLACMETFRVGCHEGGGRRRRRRRRGSRQKVCVHIDGQERCPFIL